MAPKKILFISGSPGLGHMTGVVAVARDLRRLYHGIDISRPAAMTYSKTTPGALAKAIMKNPGKAVTSRDIPADGSRRAAELMTGVL